MTEPKVCALVRGGPPMVEAVERQTRPADELAVNPPGPPAGPADWLWLLDRGAVPEPDALERLLDTLDGWRGEPSPVLLASKIVDAAGSPDDASLPVPQVIGDQDLVVTAFERHTFPIRVARAGSLLVKRGPVEELGLPRAGADLDWTARILRDGLGLLVPASVAVRGGGSDEPGLAPRLKLLLGSGLRAREKPLFAFRLAERLRRRA